MAGSDDKVTCGHYNDGMADIEAGEAFKHFYSIYSLMCAACNACCRAVGLCEEGKTK